MVLQKQAVAPSTITLSELLDMWIATVKLDLAETTRYAYQIIIDKHISPALGSVKLQDLSPIQIQRYYAEKVKILSVNSVRKHHDLLLDACSKAVKMDFLRSNPVEKVDPPRVVRREVECYTAEQVMFLLSAAKGTLAEYFLLLAAFCGMRRGEILGLALSQFIDPELCRKIILSSYGKVAYKGDYYHTAYPPP